MKTLQAALLSTSILALGAQSCASAPAFDPVTGAARSKGAVEVTILQVNDVYEIAPVSGGAAGGLARVATIRKQLLERTPNVFTVLAGDFVNPSALATAVVDGEPLAGRQMVSSLNAMGLDLAVFGNHEFDAKDRSVIDKRIAERHFAWLSGNVDEASGAPFDGLPRSYVAEFAGPGGAKARIGFVAATIDETRRPYLRYEDPVESIRAQVASLRDKVDAIIAVTHLALAADMRLAREVPELDLILGGHEHENMLVRRGERVIPIAKADANARSVYVHLLRVVPRAGPSTGPSTRPSTGPLQGAGAEAGGLESVDSFFRKVDRSVPEDPAAAAVVADWMKRGFDGFRKAGFEPTEPVGRTPIALDGLESSVRNHSTALTDAVGASMLEAAPGVEIALHVGGGIRIDDVIPPGEVTRYDVARIFPFADKLVTARMSGKAIQELARKGAAAKGTGLFLLTAGLKPEELKPARSYRVVTTGFLAGVFHDSIVPGSQADSIPQREALARYLAARSR